MDVRREGLRFFARASAGKWDVYPSLLHMALLVGHQPRLVLTLFLLPYLLFSCLYGLFIRESPMLPIIYPPSPPPPLPVHYRGPSSAGSGSGPAVPTVFFRRLRMGGVQLACGRWSNCAFCDMLKAGNFRASVCATRYCMTL